MFSDKIVGAMKHALGDYINSINKLIRFQNTDPQLDPLIQNTKCKKKMKKNKSAEAPPKQSRDGSGTQDAIFGAKDGARGQDNKEKPQRPLPTYKSPPGLKSTRTPPISPNPHPTRNKEDLCDIRTLVIHDTG